MMVMMEALAPTAPAAEAAATSPPVSFNIGPQSLSSALTELALQARLQIVFKPELVQDLQSQGVSGTITVDAALAALLDAAGLSASRPVEGVVTVVRATPQKDAAARIPVPMTEPMLDEVIVTAARRSQDLQKVSATVAAVPGTAAVLGGMTTIAEIANKISGLQVTGQPGGYSLNIRGQGGDLPAPTTQGSVALEFDGVYNINAQAGTVGFFDIDRIELLAGPQSTRYGPNADGGVVNVISRDPVLGEFGGDVALNVGNYERLRGEAAVNLPLGDTMALRVAAAGIQRKSYFTPAEGDDVGQSVRLKFLYQPDDALSLKVQYQLDHVGGTGYGSNVLPIFTTRVTPYGGDSINDHGDPWKEGGDHPSNGLGSGQDAASLYQRNLLVNASYRVNDWAALDLLGSYLTLGGTQHVCTNYPPSGPGWGPWTTNGAGNCFAVTEFNPFYQYSGEARLHSIAGSRVVWNLGLYHWNYYWAYWPPFQATVGTAARSSSSTATDAGYGELTWPLTDHLRVTAGARQSFDLRRQNFGPNGAIPTPTLSLRENHFDYRAGLEIDLGSSSMAYATVASGYRPGGLNQLLPDGSATRFGNEVINAFELGSKNLLLNSRLQLNISAFYYLQRGYQDLDKYFGAASSFVVGGQTIICDNTTVGQYSQCQTPTFGLKAHALGAELQLRFRFTSDDQINLSATGLDARFNRHQPGQCAVLGAPSAPGCWDGYNPEGGPNAGTVAFFNIAGAVQPHSPRFSSSLGYDHTVPLAGGARFVVGGNAFYSAGYYVNPVEDAYGWQPEFWQENLDASWSSANGDWTLSGYVHNLSNYAVKESVLPATSIGDPRTYGLVISRKW